MIGQDFSNLTGKILIASPYTMEGNVFHKSLIYVVHHSETGSVGFIFNRLIVNTPVSNFLKKTDQNIDLLNLELHIGGPMDLEKGIFLHSCDYTKNLLFKAENSNFAVSSNLEILKDIQEGRGPKFKMFLIGRTVWMAGEMETEIENNFWIVAEPSENLIFGPADSHSKWSTALASLGVDSCDFAPSSIGHC